MCGIAGYVDFEGDALDQIILDSMVNCLRRRGPDADGTIIDGPCGLAQTRLSIIDIEHSTQPMSRSDITLSYNGEIYNFQLLRNLLLDEGVKFDTAGDTEVVLRGVAREWADFLPRLEGMYAFAAWDRRRQKLLLARDPVGEKPLYWSTPSPGVLVFGSSVNSVLQHPASANELSIGALRDVLQFRALYDLESLNLGVHQLEPGCYLEFDRAGLVQGRFFDLVERTSVARRRLKGKDEQALIAEGWDLFRSSVERRLVADVPVGAFLSGGMDSSIVVAAMREVRGPSAEIHTFSVGFSEDPHNELPFAQEVAEHLGTRHHPVNVAPEDFQRRWAELSDCRDSPLSEPAEVAFAQMSHLAKKQVKVVLSGDGADEIFAGYPKYAYAEAPAILRWGLRLIGPDNGEKLSRLVGLDPVRFGIASRAISQTTETDRIVQWLTAWGHQQLPKLLPGLDWTAAHSNGRSAIETAVARAAAGGGPPLARMQVAECLTWLPGRMLHQSDRMSMSEGLELRSPFLDKSLVAFALALPNDLKIRGQENKWMERQWGIGRLPPQINRRQKWGFKVPLARWFRGPLKSMMLRYLIENDGICRQFGDIGAIKNLLSDHIEGRIDAHILIWTLMSAEVWYQDVYMVRRRRLELAA